jgi:hypothetical protein
MTRSAVATSHQLLPARARVNLYGTEVRCSRILSGAAPLRSQGGQRSMEPLLSPEGASRWQLVANAGCSLEGLCAAISAGWRIHWRIGNKSPANWHFLGGLDNRFGPLGPTRVRIPPPPPHRSSQERQVLRTEGPQGPDEVTVAELVSWLRGAPPASPSRCLRGSAHESANPVRCRGGSGSGWRRWPRRVSQ